MRGLSRRLGAATGAGQTEGHVGLTAAEPKIAHEDIGESQALRTAVHDQFIRAAGGRRGDLRLPASGGVGDGGGFTTSDGNHHLGAGLGPAPDGVELAALEHHVLAEEWSDKGPRVGGRQEGQAESESESAEKAAQDSHGVGNIILVIVILTVLSVSKERLREPERLVYRWPGMLRRIRV